MSISLTGSMTAASSTACSWIANTARSAGNAVSQGATKVANLVASAFRALAFYSAVAYGQVKHTAFAGMEAMKANPKITAGAGLAVLVLAAAAYAYKQRAAV